MTVDQFIARWLPTLGGLADFFESIKAQYPDTAPMLDPKIAALRAAADPVLLGNVAGVSLAELQTLLQTLKLDPRPHPDNLAS